MSSSHLNSICDVHGRAPLTAGHHRIVEGNDRYIGRAGIARAITACDGVSRHMEPSPKQKIISMIVDTYHAGDSKSMASNIGYPLVSDSCTRKFARGTKSASTVIGSEEPTAVDKMTFANSKSPDTPSECGCGDGDFGQASKPGELTAGEASVFPNNLSLRLLAVQALLLQFRDPGVRNDFTGGNILFAESKSIQLENLDELACALLPCWRPGSGRLLLKTQANLQNLITSSSGNLLLQKSKISKPFAQWYKILHSLASSSYWHSMKPLAHRPTNLNLLSLPMNNEIQQSAKAVTHLCALAGNVAVQISSSADKQAEPSRADREGYDGVPIKESKLTVSLMSCGGQGKGKPSEQPEFLSGHANDNLQSLNLGRDSRGNKEPVCVSYDSLLDSKKFIPTCSICSKPHLGMHCRALQLQLKCHWCGRTGHNEGSCWRKSGACLICGSANHRLRQCARYIPLKPPVFPPRCLLCGSNHLSSEVFVTSELSKEYNIGSVIRLTGSNILIALIF